jgi:hypothetical protein
MTFQSGYDARAGKTSEVSTADGLVATPISAHPGVPSEHHRTGLAVTALVLLVVAGAMGGAAQLLEYAFPVAALAVGALLYRSAPTAYMAFAWWIWFVTPGLRRYLEYHGSWNQVTPIVLTPYLVSGITLISVVRHLPKLKRLALAPFALLLAAVGYGYLLGILRWGFLASTYGALTKIVPIAFGLHIAMAVRRTDQYWLGVERAFLWGMLVVSIYGIVQYIAPASWDAYWMANVEMVSIGRPLPYEVRVFSTLNSPGPLATVLAAGLLVLLASRNGWRWPVTALTLLTFLLTLVRGVWAAWLLGLAVYVAYLPWRTRWRLMTVLAILALAVPLFILGEPFDPVRTRMLTLVNLGSDVSFVQRMALIPRIAEVIVGSPLGTGIGATGVSAMLHGSASGIRDFDNGILETLYSLGWAAGGAFLIGTAWLLLRAFRVREAADNRLLKAARAIAVCVAFTAVFGDAFSGVAGMLLWTFLGLLASAEERTYAGSQTSLHDHR